MKEDWSLRVTCTVEDTADGWELHDHHHIAAGTFLVNLEKSQLLSYMYVSQEFHAYEAGIIIVYSI